MRKIQVRLIVTLLWVSLTDVNFPLTISYSIHRIKVA